MIGFVSIGLSAFMRTDISENENIWIPCEACFDVFEVRRDIAYEMWREQDEMGIPVTCPICLYSDDASCAIEIGHDKESASTKR
ncbi:MAG: hypothetical protein OXU23_24055 [Candidatus Poribacteria bacterium]|nr:hypothetical protein [Candidatus Poribacteria bacterium]